MRVFSFFFLAFYSFPFVLWRVAVHIYLYYGRKIKRRCVVSDESGIASTRCLTSSWYPDVCTVQMYSTYFAWLASKRDKNIFAWWPLISKFLYIKNIILLSPPTQANEHVEWAKNQVGGPQQVCQTSLEYSVIIIQIPEEGIGVIVTYPKPICFGLTDYSLGDG